jgi:hypothetical protein
MKTKHISGKLIPNNIDAYNRRTYLQIYNALYKNNLCNAIHLDDGWEKGIIEIDTIIGAPLGEVTGQSTTPESLQIIAAFDSFMKAEEVVELALNGVVTFSIEDTATNETNTVRITVKEGQLYYQHASFVWTEKTTI